MEKPSTNHAVPLNFINNQRCAYQLLLWTEIYNHQVFLYSRFEDEIRGPLGRLDGKRTGRAIAKGPGSCTCTFVSSHILI